MMSKNSFLVSIKENNKRRLWVWIISALSFVLAFPVLTAFTINIITRNAQWITESYGNTVAEQIIHERVISGMHNMLGFNLGIFLLTVAIAVVSAIQGFSYLYSRKKIDFYMGMPIKRKKRFLVIWLNGILLYLLPYLLGLAISMLIAAGNGAMDQTVLSGAAVAFLVNLSFYLGVYHMTILAVMLTGNIVITGFAFLVFCLYEFMVRVVLEGYKEIFFKYFTYFGSSKTPVLSPFSMFSAFAEKFRGNAGFDGKSLAELLIFAVIVGGISYICYMKRPSEAAGKAMTFEITKPFVKILLVTPASLLMGAVVSDAVNFIPEKSMDGIGWMIFAMVFTAVIGSALIQVIYEFDIKGCIHKKSHIVVSGVLVALIFISFRYDLFGYDGYIPNQSQIESIAFIPEYYEEQAYGRGYFDSNGNYLSCQNYASKYMFLDNIEEICDMADFSMKEYDKLDRYQDTDDWDDLEDYWAYATIIYRLKNGREVNRCIWVNVEDSRTAAILDHVIGSENFKKGYAMGASDTLSAMIDNVENRYKISASYGNRVYEEKMSNAEAKELLEIYRRDMLQADFSRIKENAPVGVLRFDISEEIYGSVYMMNGAMSRSTMEREVAMYVYPFYEESIAYLKDHGYYMDSQVKLEDIAKIQIMNHNYEIAEELQEERLTAVGAAAIETDSPEVLLALGASEYPYGIDTRVYVDYTDEDQIKEMIDYIYPRDLVINDWDNGKSLDEEYEVIVYFKTGSEMTRNFGTNAYYGFLKGELPDFVREDTIYKPAH